jgi:hypothetical protein
MLIEQRARERPLRRRFAEHIETLSAKEPSPFLRRVIHRKAKARGGAAATTKQKRAGDGCRAGQSNKCSAVDVHLVHDPIGRWNVKWGSSPFSATVPPAQRSSVPALDRRGSAVGNQVKINALFL